MSLEKFQLLNQTVYLVRTRSGYTFFGDTSKEVIAAAVAHVAGR